MSPDEQRSSSEHLFDCSVVIPTRNRVRHLELCLRALCSQTEDADHFEVIVADDGSTDGTPLTLSRLRTPFQLRTLTRPPDGAFAARNAGGQAALGRVCIFLDDDVIAGEELVAEHLSAHRRSPRSFAFGQLVQFPARGWYAREFARAWCRSYESLESRAARWTDASCGNLSVERAAFLEAGGFSVMAPAATADIEFGYRLHRYGLSPVYLPRAWGRHDDGKGRARLLEDARRRGEANAELGRRELRMLPELLDWCGEATHRERALRRGLIELGVPPAALALLGPLCPSTVARRIWFEFVSRYAYWLAVRRAMDRSRWTALTTEGHPRHDRLGPSRSRRA